MSDKQQKIDEKEARRAAKEALKEKQARTKQSKAKKGNDVNVFVRIARSIKRFFKDFRGTAKKIVWPDRKTVFKSTLVVLVVVLIVGSGIWIADFVLTNSIGAIERGIESMNEEKTSEEADDVIDDIVGGVSEDAHDHEHDDDHADEDASANDDTSADGAELASEETDES